MKLIPIVLAMALLAGACSGDDSDTAAVASSSAQQAEAAEAQADGSPFCRAINALEPYPFTDFTLADTELASRLLADVDRQAVDSASASYRAVAQAVPTDAPNIVTYFFDAIPDVVAAAFRSQEALAFDPEYLAALVTAGSFRTSDIQTFVQAECPDASFQRQPFSPLFALPQASLFPPSQPGFCSALADLEQLITLLDASNGRDEIEIPLIENAVTTLHDVTGLLAGNANRSTVAYLRSVHYLFANAFVDEEAAFLGFALISQIDGPAAAADLQSTCPDIADPRNWLLAYFADPGSGGVDGTANSTDGPANPTVGPVERVEGAFDTAGEGSNGTSSALITEIRSSSTTIMVGDTEATVGNAYFLRTLGDGSAGDSFGGHLNVLVSFDSSHELTTADFALTAPDGTIYPHDPDQPIGPDDVQIQFAVDREIASTNGWTLRIGDATIDL